MRDLSKIIGMRIRNYRIKNKLSQEKLAELAKCHPTYIGQIERGEKNATLESIEKISSALGVSLEKLFEKIGDNGKRNEIPLKCYDLLNSKSEKEQEILYSLLLKAEEYKEN